MAGVKGRSGARPKPTGLKVLHGTDRKDRAPKREPQPASKLPTRPSWLAGYGRSVWDRIARDLWKLGLLTPVDRDVFAALCAAVGRLKDAQDLINKEGLVITTDAGNRVPHPAVAIANRASDIAKSLSVEFGLTPASRAGLNVEPPSRKNEKEETADRLLGPKSA